MIATSIANIIGFIGIFFMIKYLKNKFVLDEDNRKNIGFAIFFTSISLAIHGIIDDLSSALLFLSCSGAICAYIIFDQNLRKEELEKKGVNKCEKKKKN